MGMSNTAITPGAVVTGTYYGVEIIGRVVHIGDWSPAVGVLVTVQLDGPVVIGGAPRDLVCLAMGKLALVDACSLPARAGVNGWTLTAAADCPGRSEP